MFRCIASHLCTKLSDESKSRQRSIEKGFWNNTRVEKYFAFDAFLPYFSTKRSWFTLNTMNNWFLRQVEPKCSQIFNQVHPRSLSNVIQKLFCLETQKKGKKCLYKFPLFCGENTKTNHSQGSQVDDFQKYRKSQMFLVLRMSPFIVIIKLLIQQKFHVIN